MNIRMFPDCPNSASSSHPSFATAASLTRRAAKHRQRRRSSTPATQSTVVAHLSLADRELLLRRQALASAQRGDYSQAIALFDLLIDQNPLNPSHYNNRGLIHYQIGQLEQALVDYDFALRLNPKLAKVYNNRANCYIALGEMEAAIADYDMAIDLNPTNIHALINQGITFRDLELHEQAIGNFDFALHLCNLLHQTEISNTRLAGHIYAERGRTHHLAGDWNCAIADYQRALAELPSTIAQTTSARLRSQVESWLESLIRPLSA